MEEMPELKIKGISEQSGKLKPVSNKLLQPAEQQLPSAKDINQDDFLESFEHSINPSTIISIEKRPDGAIVMHCNNFYEYLKFGYREDPEEVEKIEKHKLILEKFSKPETVNEARQLKNELPLKQQAWIDEKLNDEGSAVPVKFADGRKEAIVIMNDMPTRRMFNKKDGTLRDESQLQKYDREYKRTVEHEARHVKYYKKYGKNLEARRKALENIRPLTLFEQRKYYFDRYTKDEVCAHIENSVREVGDKVEVDWDNIMKNLQKDDYGKFKESSSDSELAEYGAVSTALVAIARDEYKRTKSINSVMNLLAGVDVQKIMNQDKIDK